MGFLELENRRFVVFGLANKKSVACAIARVLAAEGSEVIHVVRTEERRATARKLFPGMPVLLCDVEDEADIVRVRDEIAAAIGAERGGRLDGIVHSIAFANYSDGFKPFHQTVKRDFLQAVDISCFSFISIANHFKDLLDPDASMLTISISTTRMAAENYGYMAPIKAALNSSLCFLAKSFSAFSRIRFNAVAPGLREDLGLRRHSRLCRQLSLRRKGNPAQTGAADRGGGEHRGLPAVATVVRHQRPGHCRRCRDGGELFRPGDRQ